MHHHHHQQDHQHHDHHYFHVYTWRRLVTGKHANTPWTSTSICNSSTNIYCRAPHKNVAELVFLSETNGIWWRNEYKSQNFPHQLNFEKRGRGRNENLKLNTHNTLHNKSRMVSVHNRGNLRSIREWGYHTDHITRAMEWQHTTWM